MLCLAAKAAAAPAACPIAMQEGIILAEEAASCVAEKHLPATRRLSISFGIKDLYGISLGREMVPVCAP